MARDSRERARRLRHGMGHAAARVSFAPQAHASYPQRIAAVSKVGGAPHVGAALTLRTASDLLEAHG